MELKEWLNHYINYLNSFKKDLIKKQGKGNMVLCEHKHKSIAYLVSESLNNIKKESFLVENAVVVCLNKKDNLEYIIKNWHNLIKNKSLKIMLVNPEKNEQWSIMPYTHNLFCDKKALKKGIKSLFESVPEVPD